MLHAALPDMRLPIAFGLLYPERVDVGAEAVPFDGSAGASRSRATTYSGVCRSL